MVYSWQSSHSNWNRLNMSFLLVFYLPQSKIICLHDPALHISQASFLLLFLSPYSSITSHTHNWVLLLLWFCLFILSEVILPLISSSMLCIYRSGEVIFRVLSFYPSYCSWGSQGKNTEVVCHSLLQWTTFSQSSPPWPIHLGWPYAAWLIVSLS